MHTMPYLIKNTAGVWCVQRKVPEKLQAAVARLLDSKKAAQAYLKRSLGTKDRREATRRAPHVLADLDRILKDAKGRLKQPTPKTPQRSTLNDAEIKRMAEYVYAKALAWDERTRYGRDELKRMEAEFIRLEGRTLSEPWAFPYDTLPEHGLSAAQLAEDREQLTVDLKDMREYLALGNIAAVEEQITDALNAFNIDLDRKSAAYSKLGIEVLRAYVRALQAIEQRNAGEPVPTPVLASVPSMAASGTLREALDGWKKERDRPEDGVHEYTRAVEMFIELHGNLTIAEIRRSHATQFREALRQVPKTRKGPLLKAGLLELRQWSQEHPGALKVSAGTVNKQLGAVQTIINWGFRNGLVPDEVPWADPFKDARLEGEQSTRDAFDPHGLKAVFDAPLFTDLKIPAGGKGLAAVWLPLLALFMGGRQGEFASLRVSDIREDAETHIPLMWIIRDATAGKRVKTDAGERVVPIHPQIIQLGFLDYVAQRKAEDGNKAWLFPAVAPDQRGGRKAWAKWWGHYLRDHIGVEDRNLVFHSFRHGFQDALRRATPDEELRDALAGRSAAGKSVSRTYGAKQMLQRWGVRKLHEVICAVSFPGLDLSRVKPLGSSMSTRGDRRNQKAPKASITREKDRI
jgi:hypothetical protein